MHYKCGVVDLGSLFVVAGIASSFYRGYVRKDYSYWLCYGLVGFSSGWVHELVCGLKITPD